MTKDYSHLFKTDHLRKNIKKAAIKGNVSVMSSHMVGMAIEVASVVVLARLLTPSDFGLIGMVLTATNFAKLFRDIGLSMATIQRAEITHEQVSLMFWVNVGIGLLLTLLTAGAAPLVAWFYKEPRLIGVTIALSASFLFSASAIQHNALLRRQMKFGQISVLYVLSIALSVAVALVCAVAGMGYWSLVVRNLAQPLVYMIGVWWLSPWMPGPPRLRVGGRSLLAFGAHITGFNVVNYFTRNLDNVLIGKKCGAEMMGYYAQAYKILLFPINQIRQPFLSTGIPALSALQNHPDEYRRHYRGIVSVIALLSMPLVGLLFVCAEPIIFAFLGAPWLPAVPLFRILALVAILQPTVTAGRALPLMSMGQGRRYFWFGIINSSITVLSFVIGIAWGAVGVATGYAISNLFLSVFLTEWCMRGSPLKGRDFWGGVWRPALSTLAAVGAAEALRAFGLNAAFPVVTVSNALLHGLLCGAAGMAVGLSVFIALPGGREELSRMMALARGLRKSQRSKSGMSSSASARMNVTSKE